MLANRMTKGLRLGVYDLADPATPLEMCGPVFEIEDVGEFQGVIDRWNERLRGRHFGLGVFNCRAAAAESSLPLQPS